MKQSKTVILSGSIFPPSRFSRTWCSTPCIKSRTGTPIADEVKSCAFTMNTKAARQNSVGKSIDAPPEEDFPPLRQVQHTAPLRLSNAEWPLTRYVEVAEFLRITSNDSGPAAAKRGIHRRRGVAKRAQNNGG